MDRRRKYRPIDYKTIRTGMVDWKVKKHRFSKRSLERIRKVESTKDIVNDWEDWTPECFKRWNNTFRLFKPPPILTVSQWADTYRQISSEFASEPGQWHTDKFEPMREVMDACSPHSRFKRIVLVKPTQSGGTESVVLNVIGYTIDINPRSILVVFPTLDLAESFSKERLEPMIAVTPTLTDKVIDSSSARGGTASTVKKKKYPGGFLNMAGSNSTTGLSSRPVPIVIIDEVDLCIKNASRQGSPVKLALARTTTFFDKKEIILSSPSNEEGESGIIPFWDEGTKAKLETECPNVNCRHYQVLNFDNMDYDTAMLPCEKCGKHFPQWRWQNSFRRWNHSDPNHPTTATFWMSGLDSPWLDWKIDLCLEYLEAKKLADMGDDSLLRVFVNSKLARHYKRKGKKVEIDLYHERREVYPCHKLGVEVPDEVILITVGVDVMDSFITYDAIGWGRGRESWGIETGSFQGDPSIPDSIVWKQLDDFVYNRLWTASNGKYFRTRLMFVDSQGHCTNDVYAYCKPRHPRVFAIKGVGGEGHPIIIGGKRREKGAGTWLIRLGVDTIKNELHSRLSVDKSGPGYCHWPMLDNGMPCCGYALEYFEEIVSEQREIAYSKGFAKYEWTKDRHDPNEALDMQVYARGALEFLKIKLEQMDRDIIEAMPLQDIERVEIGLDKFITIRRKDTTIDKEPIYGTRGQLISEASGPSRPERPPERRTTTKYGAIGTSFG